MAGGTQDDIWPLPNSRYRVTGLCVSAAAFQEAAGLESETAAVQYRTGGGPGFYPVKMPGLGTVGNVTLRKGIFVNDTGLLTWFDAIKSNTVARGTIVVALVDAGGAVQMAWTLTNAWPTKITGTDLKSGGNEVAVESVEIAFETLAVSGG